MSTATETSAAPAHRGEADEDTVFAMPMRGLLRRNLGESVYGLAVQIGNLQFLPGEDHRRFFSGETKGVSIAAGMCKECGMLTLTGDAAKLRRIENS